MASASTTRRRWPSSCATWASRPGSPWASCRARAMRRPARSASSTATPTPGSRSTSRASAGSRFDPTGGNVSQLAAAAVRADPSPAPSRVPSSGASAALDPAGRIPARAFGPGGRTPSAAPRPRSGRSSRSASCCSLIVLAIAFIAWQRGPRGATVRRRGVRHGRPGSPRDFGFGPRPTQTVYEYAGALGDVLPDARPELQTVARAKVESSYGRVDPRRRPDGQPAARPAAAAGQPPAARLPAEGPPRGCAGADGQSAPLRRRASASAVATGAGPLAIERPGGRSGCAARRTGSPGPQLDDGDPAQVHRPHPEPLERQVEQRQQGDLEDAVVADDDRPGVVRRRVAVAGDLRPVVACPAAARRPSRPRIASSAGRTRAGDLGERLAARRPVLERGSTPGRRARRRSAPRSRSRWSPCHRPGRSRGSPGRAGADRATRRRPAIAASIAAAVSVVATRAGEWTSSSGGADRHRQGRRGRGAASRGRTSVGLEPADRRSAAIRPGPGSGPRR